MDAQTIHERAIQASRRMVARGEEPLFRPRWELVDDEYRVTVPELGLTGTAYRRTNVRQLATAMIAEALECAPDAFRIEVDEPR